MLLRTVYTVVVGRLGRPSNLALPFTVEIEDGVRCTLSDGSDGNLRLVIERRVDPAALEAVVDTRSFRTLSDGSEEPRRLLKLRNDTAPESVYAEDVVNAVSFLSDVPLGLSKPPFDGSSS